VSGPPLPLERLRRAAAAPVDIASLAAFRIIFGAVMCGGLVRFLATGWIEAMYGEPSWFFTYPGFAWVKPWPVAGMYAHYGVLAALALSISLGFCYRPALLLFLGGFTYTQLIDVTNYLNHHYLVVLIGLLLLALPADAAWSLDARRRPARRRAQIPAWMVWLLRFQVGVVYGFAGLAKAKLDWLGYGQPLNLWLSARTEVPLLGRWFDEPALALAMSWGGFLFDTTVVLWLSWWRTRRFAFAALVVFHGLTGALFNIGMFPIIMTSSALIFFAPDWPRRALRALGQGRWAEAPPLPEAAPSSASSSLSLTSSSSSSSSPSSSSGGWRPRLLAALLCFHVAMQLALPLRHFFYGGDVLWNERGMRFAWHVMIREKHGAVTFEARFADGRRLEIPSANYLTARQEREMGGQPDLIAQLGRFIGRELERRGHGDFAIHAVTQVSLNGRPPLPMIDPESPVYRSAQNRSAGNREGVGEPRILSGPTDPPPTLRPLR
jgi:vitamin K-dependent gamma-carboxylase